MATTRNVLSLPLSPSLLLGLCFCSVKDFKWSEIISLSCFVLFLTKNRITFCCGTTIYQSGVCTDNEYHTCGLSLASAAKRVILKIATCVLWNVGHKGESVSVSAEGEILPRVWELKCIVSTPTSLLKYFVWVFLSLRAPNRCKIAVLWKKIDLIVIIISSFGIV